MTHKNPHRYTELKNFPPFIDRIVTMLPKHLPIDGYARTMCTHCGLYNRAILCPPLLAQTYPQFATIDSSKAWFDTFRWAYVYIFKNDGTKRWWYKKEHERYQHIALVKHKARKLKGVEASSSRKLTHMMRKIKNVNRKAGFEVETFIQGHCDLCARKCPNRENPPCHKGGLASMEATGINVYKLLRQLGIPYEYPVINYLTQVTMMVVK